LTSAAVFRVGRCALIITLLALPAHALDPRVGDVDPVMPADKVDRALNGTFNFPPSPPAPWTPDERGFAKDRLFHVPPPGVHPRILFAPEDLPRIRHELASNEVGRATLAAIRAQLAKGIETKSTWEGQCYAALAAGDLDGFKRAFKENPLDDVPPGSGFKMNVPGRTPATKWGVRNPLLASMEAAAFIALIDDDKQAGMRAATALATYAAFISPKVDAANQRPRHEFQWYSTRYLVPSEISYGYDWAWPWMTPAQRDIVRSVIVRATAGKYTLGMDLPAHWRNWNHLGLTESYASGMFAIEGEPGDDPRGRDRIFEVYRDYLSYSIDDLGTGTEGIGYQTAGIGHISSPLVAFANRGRNLLVHPHWRLHTESWLVQAMQPFGGAWQSCSDLANFPPNLSLVAVQKYFYPDSPGIDFVYRNTPLVAQRAWDKIALDSCEVQWITPSLPAAHDTRAAAQQQAAALVGGGLTFYDKERGFLYTRTGWGLDDVALHVDAKRDSYFANHDHADRGQFNLAALGRAWACDGYRDTESKYHNVVTIDGRGQGYFATPASWIEETDNARETTAVVDTKYCWDWQWMKSSFTESLASLTKRDLASFADSAARLQSRVPLAQWEPDPTVSAYYAGFADRAHGDPRMWDDEDGWVLRAPWYPVRKAFRTVILGRGKHAYVLVADDIRKDDAEHLYEWRMNMPPEVAAVSINGPDILLGDETTHREPAELKNAFQGTTGLVPAKGDRLLLVRTLEVAVPALPTLQPIPLVATIEYKKTDDSHQFTGRSNGMGTQVIIGSRSVEPGFVILLYPHRQGDELPTTTWNDDKSQLTVTWTDQTDTYKVSTGTDGRRVFALQP
jgi:hypothetical protein